uniref:Uncharacterized protein n=1 Tax=Siphoviridae sp. ctINK4 TaxID=2825428 RepID=A0A8S5NWM0_9CAUD|nr:MAG TPA: hypothetical protein [Siphoviridae sp. ctINK4]
MPNPRGEECWCESILKTILAPLFLFDHLIDHPFFDFQLFGGLTSHLHLS